MSRDRLGFIGLPFFLTEQQLWGPDPTWAPRRLEETIQLLLIRKASHVQKKFVSKKIGGSGVTYWLSPCELQQFCSSELRGLCEWVTSVARICSAREISTWTQQTPEAFGNPSPLAYFTQMESEGKNKFQNVQIILKASYNSLLQSPQSLDITKFILDVKTQELICSCIKSSADLEQNPSNWHSFC